MLHHPQIFRPYRILLMMCCVLGSWLQEAKGQNPFAGGSGTTADPYLIATPAQLAKLAELVNMDNSEYYNKCYKLIADLDLSDYGTNFNGGAGWIPIGIDNNNNYYYYHFKGEFDGNNKKITGLYINSIFRFTGLFGMIESTKVQNLGIEGADITGSSTVGGVVGGANNSSVTNCYSTGTIIATHDEYDNAVVCWHLSVRCKHGFILALNCYQFRNLSRFNRKIHLFICNHYLRHKRKFYSGWGN